MAAAPLLTRRSQLPRPVLPSASLTAVTAGQVATRTCEDSSHSLLVATEAHIQTTAQPPRIVDQPPPTEVLKHWLPILSCRESAMPRGRWREVSFYAHLSSAAVAGGQVECHLSPSGPAIGVDTCARLTRCRQDEPSGISGACAAAHSGSGMPRLAARAAAASTLSAIFASNAESAFWIWGGGPRSKSARGGGRRSSMSSMHVARESIT